MHSTKGNGVRSSWGQGFAAVCLFDVVFSVWFFFPSPKSCFPISSCFDLCFAACGSEGRSLDIQTPLQSSGENGLREPRARTLQPCGSFSLTKAHGPSSSGQVKAPRTHRRRYRDGKNVPQEDRRFCWSCFCNLTVQGSKPHRTKNIARKSRPAATSPLSFPSRCQDTVRFLGQ